MLRREPSERYRCRGDERLEPRSPSGEQVIFQGHPSWRAILGFYLKGILVAAIVGVIAKLFGAGSATSSWSSSS